MPRKSKFNLPPLEQINKETIGERIARLRKERGMTQTQLAAKIGIIQALVTDYERNKLRLYDEMIIRFALALGVTSDQILGIKKNKRPETTAVNLRFVRRLKAVEKLPEARKKAILRTIDDLIIASEKKAS